jgi:hypothetical protein
VFFIKAANINSFRRKIKMCIKNYQEYFEAYGRNTEEIEKLKALDSKVFKEENVLVK